MILDNKSLWVAITVFKESLSKDPLIIYIYAKNQKQAEFLANKTLFEQNIQSDTIQCSSLYHMGNDLGFKFSKENPQNPFKEAIILLTTSIPDINLNGVYNSKELSDDDFVKLQDWIGMNQPVPWATSIGMIEMADTMVQEAVGNGNIPNKEE